MGQNYGSASETDDASLTDSGFSHGSGSEREDDLNVQFKKRKEIRKKHEELKGLCKENINQLYDFLQHYAVSREPLHSISKETIKNLKGDNLKKFLLILKLFYTAKKSKLDNRRDFYGIEALNVEDFLFRNNNKVANRPSLEESDIDHIMSIINFIKFIPRKEKDFEESLMSMQPDHLQSFIDAYRQFYENENKKGELFDLVTRESNAFLYAEKGMMQEFLKKADIIQKQIKKLENDLGKEEGAIVKQKPRGR